MISKQINYNTKRGNAVKRFEKLGDPVYDKHGVAWWKCHYCGGAFIREDMTVDHKIALSNGGINLQKNLAQCCDPCNKEKGRGNYEKFMGKKKHLRKVIIDN